MMFDMFCVEKILAKEKTVTRRIASNLNRRPAVPGHIHKLKVDRTPKTYGRIRITDCSLDFVGDIDDKEAIKEGFSSRREYIDYFMDTNNIDMLNDYDLLWRVEFELLKD